MRSFWRFCRGMGWVILLVAFCAGSSNVEAQALNQRPAVGDLRGLQTAPAPKWLRPGIRLTYYSALANVPGTDEFWEANENGNWIDRRTGQRYFKRRPSSDTAGSGHGYTQVNVVSMDGRQVVLEVRAYSFPKYQGPLALVSASSEVTILGFGQDWWANPEVLQGARNGSFGGLTVLRMNHALDGRTYPALRIQFEGTRPVALTGIGGEMRPGKLKSRHVLVYGIKSGVLLTASTSGASSHGITYTECSLKNSRHVPVPWAGMAAPAWVNRVRELKYTGSLHVPYGARQVSAPLSVSFSLLRRGRDWGQFQLESSLAGPIPSMPKTSTANVVTGSAQFGGLWVPPAGLRALRVGQVLDQDPLTGVEVTVSSMNESSVVISEINTVQRMDYTYRRSDGLLVQYTRVDFHQYNIKTSLRFAGSR
jgi:hypothetical protein